MRTTAGRARIAVLVLACLAASALALVATRKGPAPASMAWRSDAPKGEVLTFAVDPRDVAVVSSDLTSGIVTPDTYHLAVLSGSTGEVKWQQPLAGIPVAGGPIAIDRDLIVAGSISLTAVGNYGFVARDTRSGRLRWQTTLPRDVARLTHLLLTRDGVVGFTPGGNIWVLSRDTGERRWTAQVPRIPPDSPVRAESDRVLVFWGDPEPPCEIGIDCFSLKTGQRLWHRVMSSGPRLVRLRGLAEGGRVVFLWEPASASAPTEQVAQVQASCFRAATGEPLWTGTLPYADLVFIHGKSIYGLTGDVASAGEEHALWRADIRTGKLQGTSRHAPAIVFLPHPWAPLVAKGMAAIEARGEGEVTVRNMRVVWLDLRTGEVVGDYKGTTHGLAASEFALSDGRVICRTGRTGAVTALSPPRR
jgi:outer membrane protein assembly factor BamB